MYAHRRHVHVCLKGARDTLRKVVAVTMTALSASTPGIALQAQQEPQ